MDAETTPAQKFSAGALAGAYHRAFDRSPPCRWRTAAGSMGERERDLEMNLSSTAKSFARRLGYDIRSTGSHFYKRPIDFIRSREINLVIDVGANIGQYGANLRNTRSKQ
jgi:hypothetical protein